MSASLQLQTRPDEHSSSARRAPKILRSGSANALETVRLLEEVRDSLASDPVAARAGMDRLVWFLKAATGSNQAGRGRLLPWQKRKIESHIEEQFATPLPIGELADLVSLSPGHFRRVFKATFGCAPHAYIIERRIAHAQELMLVGSEPLSHIALICGFADQAHFANAFRRSIGTTPCDWRRASMMLL